ncbi:lysophospholipid acyltransferase family protein [Myroides profundi]|uniref:KDO2-lipid IV(A) lauroyltransferase n=1 Tax=Myroides profundi TaxID=480520 RepID=A0AAJ4W295_MYRPR|nr:lysophospholipid acyltransferase family protein [Myroides profundi]AJH15002.1 lipid A biosynthesis lauroyl acyltransferase [Myroides profundi]SEQ31831.1 KDO2-lipid IV(A) lauroyltransferase [Myroides profundi]
MQYIYNSIGFLLSKVFHYRFSVSLQNIARAFPCASYQEIAYYHKYFYRNLSRVLVETLFSKRQLLYLTQGTKEDLEEIKKENRNIILLLGHYGNWELIRQLPLSTDIPIQALYKPLKSKYWNHRIKNRREKNGIRLIPSQNALRILLKEKDTINMTVFISDQFPGKNKGIEVQFLNQKTHVYTGAEQIARKLNAYVIYGEISPFGNKKWQLSISTICQEARETKEGFISTHFTEELETSIRKDPSLWLWSHKRWK